MSESPEMKRRWAGVLVSLLVPGFGLVRAGRMGRGVGWFLALKLVTVVGAVCAALSVVPAWLAVVGIGGGDGCALWMLGDSFRPGRMTGRLWLVFGGALVGTSLLPAPMLMNLQAFKNGPGGMEPTLRGMRHGSPPDRMIVDKLSYRFSAPQRGDLIVFETSKIRGLKPLRGVGGPGEVYVKRLVGLPGERIRIADGKVFADGRPLTEADGIPAITYLAVNGESEFVVRPDEFFALGDHSANSLDSRYWGGVPASSVIGKVTMIFYPLNRVGRIPLPSSRGGGETKH